MRGFVGIVNLKDNISSFSNIIKQMTETLSKNNYNENCYFEEENILIGYHHLQSTKICGNSQSMSINVGENTFTICYNGQLYNKKDLQQTLLEKGFNFDGNSDTEVLLKAFICYGYDVVHYLNGVFAFAIWDELKKELFMSRDHFGIKPFYYSILENNFIFSSEVKAFFKFPSFPTSISQQGISELIGLRTCSHSRNNCI